MCTHKRVGVVLLSFFLLLVSLLPSKVSKSVEAPTHYLAQLKSQSQWSKEEIIEAIEFLCDIYQFPYATLLSNLAKVESQYGTIKKCGDGNKSCGLYQYRISTWEFFQQKFNRYDLNYDNHIDQIEMTILALKNGYWYYWGPLLRTYKTNPIN